MGLPTGIPKYVRDLRPLPELERGALWTAQIGIICRVNWCLWCQKIDTQAASVEQEGPEGGEGERLLSDQPVFWLSSDVSDMNL